jgi:hypothetical protein
VELHARAPLALERFIARVHSGIKKLCKERGGGSQEGGGGVDLAEGAGEATDEGTARAKRKRSGSDEEASGALAQGLQPNILFGPV